MFNPDSAVQRLSFGDVDERYLDDEFLPFVARGGLKEVAWEILQNPHLLNWCLERSYRHRNGFDKVVLWEAPDGRRLVWHGWRFPPDFEEMEKHNHRWSFVSLILSGVLYERDLSIMRGRNKLIECEYRSHSKEQSYSLRPGPLRSLAILSERTYASGDSYFKEHYVIHEAWAGCEGTATIVVQSPPLRTTCRVYTASAAGAQEIRKSVRLKVDEVTQVLRRITTFNPGTSYG